MCAGNCTWNLCRKTSKHSREGFVELIFHYCHTHVHVHVLYNVNYIHVHTCIYMYIKYMCILYICMYNACSFDKTCILHAYVILVALLHVGNMRMLPACYQHVACMVFHPAFTMLETCMLHACWCQHACRNPLTCMLHALHFE